MQHPPQVRKEREISTIEIPPTLPAEADQAVRIGARIRRLRHARKLTLVQLAEVADLSHPFLSQLERGLARPSIGSLQKIALALGSSQLELLADDDDDDAARPAAAPVSLVRAGTGVVGDYGGGEARMLTHGHRPFVPMHFAGDNTTYGESVRHAEDEFLHVLEGSVEVDLGPHGLHLLRAGDSLHFAGGTPHRWRDAAGAGYRMLIVKERSL